MALVNGKKKVSSKYIVDKIIDIEFKKIASPILMPGFCKQGKKILAY